MQLERPLGRLGRKGGGLGAYDSVGRIMTVATAPRQVHAADVVLAAKRQATRAAAGPETGGVGWGNQRGHGAQRGRREGGDALSIPWPWAARSARSRRGSAGDGLQPGDDFPGTRSGVPSASCPWRGGGGCGGGAGDELSQRFARMPAGFRDHQCIAEAPQIQVRLVVRRNLYAQIAKVALPLPEAAGIRRVRMAAATAVRNRRTGQSLEQRPLLGD